MKSELILKDHHHQFTIGIERYNMGYSVLTVSVDKWPTYTPKKTEIVISNKELGELIKMLEEKENA